VTRKKPSKKKASKKLAGTKANKVILDDIGDEPILKTRILAVIDITPEIEEILKSTEAKLYLTGIARAMSKLRAMIARETALTRHPAHPDHHDPQL
jgi:hypothetical protein